MPSTQIPISRSEPSASPPSQQSQVNASLIGIPPAERSLPILPGREGNPSLIETHATSSAGTTLLESIHEMMVDNQLVINTFIAGESES